MEDIDYAPMEVISVLLPLLETRTLSVPGHGDSIKASPGFHLFATQRSVPFWNIINNKHMKLNGFMEYLRFVCLAKTIKDYQ